MNILKLIELKHKNIQNDKNYLFKDGGVNMIKRNINGTIDNSQRGATIIIVAFAMVVLISIGALAVDLGFAYFQRTNLQKAVDSSALAGASVLYQEENGELIIKPFSVREEAVSYFDKNVHGLNADVTVDVGHWSFGIMSEKKFESMWDGYAEEITPVDLYEVGDDWDNPNSGHINSVQVEASVQSPTFFSRIFGKENLVVRSKAVAYLGFPGGFQPGEIDMPIVICKESIAGWGDDDLSCGIARLIHSGQASGNLDFNSGAWTNYSSGCELSFSAGNNPGGLQYILSDMTGECKVPNPTAISGSVSTGGGQTNVGFSEVGDCLKFPAFVSGNEDPRTEPWNITILVVDCEGSNNPSGCLSVVGAVNIDIVLITGTFPSAEGQKYQDVPYEMQDPRKGDDNKGPFKQEAYSDIDFNDGRERWKAFVDHFDLKVINQSTGEKVPAHDNYYQKTIYAVPSCTKVEKKGISGGPNFGTLAEVPVIVN